MKIVKKKGVMMPSNKKLSFKEIWETLRAVDTSSIEQQLPNNDRLTYIGWADAWVCLMGVYPEAEYEFTQPVFYRSNAEEGTCEVGCKVTIGEFSREMSLPVMTSHMPMKSIPNPTSRDISDTKARCLVKTLGMFGLGLHLWEKKTSSPTKVEMHDGGRPF